MHYMVALSSYEVERIQAMNARGEKPDTLTVSKVEETKRSTENHFENVVGQDSLTRFDKVGKNKSSKKKENKNQTQNQPAPAKNNQKPKKQEAPKRTEPVKMEQQETANVKNTDKPKQKKNHKFHSRGPKTKE